jgi:hypothetical protein
MCSTNILEKNIGLSIEKTLSSIGNDVENSCTATFPIFVFK